MRASACIILFALLLFLPAFLLGAGGVDLHCQSLWTRYFSMEFWAGNVYPRWLPEMFAGDGSPVFFYYPPLAYFTAALFAKLSPGSLFDYMPIALSSALAVLLSGFTFYLWMKQETGKKTAALLGSLVYMSAPSHVAQNFYYLLLFSSVWAYVWIPLLFLFARRVAEERPYGIPGLAVALALLTLTNLPMTAMFAPAAVIYSLLHFPRGEFGGACARLAGGIALGILLSAFYLLPALSYMDFVNIRMHWDNNGPDSIAHGRQFFLSTDMNWKGLYTLYLAVSTCLLVLYFRACPERRYRLFYGAIMAVALFLMLPISQAFWIYLPGLNLVQMAERLFSITSLCLAVLMTLALPRFRSLTCFVILFSMLATFGVALNTRVTPESFRQANPLRYDYYQLSIDQYPYYLTSPDLIARYDREGVDALKAPRPFSVTVSGDAAVTIDSWKARYIAFHYRASVPSVIRMRQFYFPGFMVSPEDLRLEVRRDSDTGEILLNLPAGEAALRLKLEPLPPELLGKAISFVAAMVTLLLVLIQSSRMHRHRPSLRSKL